MKRNKWMALLLTSALIIGSVVPAYAAEPAGSAEITESAEVMEEPSEPGEVMEVSSEPAGLADMSNDEYDREDESQEETTIPHISYRTHVQTYAWQEFRMDGEMSGTSGQAKRLEAIEIRTDDPDLSVYYVTHCQTYGWLDWSSDGEPNGTSGEAKRLEAIEIKLGGAHAALYDVHYRVHAQSYGWLGWAKNGESAGTAGYAYRLEAIEIRIVEKESEEAPTRDKAPYWDRNMVVAGMKCAQDADQIILVEASGTRCTVSMWDRIDDSWKQYLQTTDGYVGRLGVGQAHEGIARTPVGVYHIGQAFGNKPDPGCPMGYLQVDSTYWYVGDSNSPYYNKLVTTRKVNDFDKSVSENIQRYGSAYNYILDYDYNPDGTPYEGSAFFLHCTINAPTGGCVGIPESKMIEIVRHVHKGCLIVIGTRDMIMNY